MSKSGWAAPIMSANARVIGAKRPPALCPSWAAASRVNHIPKDPSSTLHIRWLASPPQSNVSAGIVVWIFVELTLQ
ncbi:hypothetical protein C0J52_04807 [Blattella germanica]|nr:hypothetical protein C0J52_04807 [Blattella germanica]